MDELDQASAEALSAMWYASVRDTIAEFGQALIGVFGTEEDPGPGFTYSIGLFEKYGYEIIVFGLPHQIAGYILNDICAKLAEGQTLELSVADRRWANLPVKFIETDETVHGYVVQADQYYRRNVRVLQMILPDKNGKFYDEVGYDAEYMNPRQIVCTTTPSPSQLH